MCIRDRLKVGHHGSFFVPQRPYITKGSLREQMLYPDEPHEQVRRFVPMSRKFASSNTGLAFVQACDDLELIEILTVLGMEYLVRREGGLGL